MSYCFTPRQQSIAHAEHAWACLVPCACGEDPALLHGDDVGQECVSVLLLLMAQRHCATAVLHARMRAAVAIGSSSCCGHSGAPPCLRVPLLLLLQLLLISGSRAPAGDFGTLGRGGQDCPQGAGRGAPPPAAAFARLSPHCWAPGHAHAVLFVHDWRHWSRLRRHARSVDNVQSFLNVSQLIAAAHRSISAPSNVQRRMQA